MLKHITPRDIVEFFLIGLLVAVLIFIAGYLESGPINHTMLVATAIAAILWVVWFVLIAIERKKKAAAPKLMICVNGEWREIHAEATKPAKTPIELRRDRMNIFDQEDPINNKEQHA